VSRERQGAARAKAGAKAGAVELTQVVDFHDNFSYSALFLSRIGQSGQAWSNLVKPENVAEPSRFSGRKDQWRDSPQSGPLLCCSVSAATLSMGTDSDAV
jgi:hypothetical protein